MRQVFFGLHLLQATDRALEFKVQLAGGIEFRQGRCSSQNELNVAVIEFVNQIDETSGLIVFLLAHLGYIFQNDGLVKAGQLYVVVLASWTVTECPETKPAYVFAGAFAVDGAARYLNDVGFLQWLMSGARSLNVFCKCRSASAPRGLK